MGSHVWGRLKIQGDGNYSIPRHWRSKRFAFTRQYLSAISSNLHHSLVQFDVILEEHLDPLRRTGFIAMGFRLMYS